MEQVRPGKRRFQASGRFAPPGRKPASRLAAPALSIALGPFSYGALFRRRMGGRNLRLGGHHVVALSRRRWS
jgi:hypothetical protein